MGQKMEYIGGDRPKEKGGTKTSQKVVQKPFVNAPKYERRREGGIIE